MLMAINQKPLKFIKKEKISTAVSHNLARLANLPTGYIFYLP